MLLMMVMLQQSMLMMMLLMVTLSMAARVRSRLILDSLSWLTNNLKKKHIHHDFDSG